MPLQSNFAMEGPWTSSFLYMYAWFYHFSNTWGEINSENLVASRYDTLIGTVADPWIRQFGFRCMTCTGDREIPRSQEEGFSKIHQCRAAQHFLDIGQPRDLGIPWDACDETMQIIADNSTPQLWNWPQRQKWPEITTASARDKKWSKALPTDGH
jgi:hypothetical protein